MSSPTFKRIGEVEVDSRRRISLGRLGLREHTRYIVSENDEGELRLVPAMTIPAREAIIWENPAIMASLRRGLEQAALDKVQDRGTFAQYVDNDNDMDEPPIA